MNTNTALAVDESPARSEQSPSPSPSPSQLSDDELLASTRRLVGRSNQLFAALLVHLAEVETRGLHRLRACSSLYVYCIYELRFSEDEAFRRVSAARLVRRFPALVGAVERGELHLTGLLLLGPHLTPENHHGVLARAKHRTKKEIAKLVRLLDPLPDVPSRIEPLGPASASSARSAVASPSWEQFAQSMNPVRELAAGERPRDWMDSELELTAVREQLRHPLHNVADANDEVLAKDSAPAPARNAPPLDEPQRYKVQFTASEEYVNLVSRAKALLSHAQPNPGLEELHLRAMRALVAELEKRKYAVNSAAPANTNAEPRIRGNEPKDDAPQTRRKPSAASAATRAPRQRGRSVPADIRRAVWSRDEGRCTYVDATTGQRCRATHRLQLHHESAFARGGAHTTSNLTLRCAAHNTLAAEADFGRDLIELRKDALRHEPCARQSASGLG